MAMGSFSPPALRHSTNPPVHPPAPTSPDKQGSILTFRLDHAISSKGMGVALPSPPQPGAITNAVLAEVERGWLLIFAMLVLGLTLASVNHAVLLAVLFGAAAACAYGLLGNHKFDVWSFPRPGL